MQVITTKYLGPTDRRGTRIKATSGPDSITMPYNHALNSLDNHREAARALRDKLEWTGMFVGGETETGTVWVLADSPAVMV